ncbi:uncharacterized protein HD556DRAFT_1390800 [Suillus plorans]|uniref:Uncharacterized protein n=1 Tax=Suillus plorans TaxID=116603 RepID=A0A9P7AJ02_9AGAM|nr:uncharacterized protein HD556DRAFT_1390800 [Suillus plorans]KAG1790521.1 hypothetical protein HD556DRAFT_1390800 [Suillus plorans]
MTRFTTRNIVWLMSRLAIAVCMFITSVLGLCRHLGAHVDGRTIIRRRQDESRWYRQMRLNQYPKVGVVARTDDMLYTFVG